MNKVILFICLMCAFSCKKEEIPTCTDETPLYAEASYPIGVAIDYLALNYDSVYNEKATNQFNSVTPENEFKPAFLHPEENFFNWNDADSLVAFAEETNKRLHGHTLIWHQQLPAWMNNFQGDANAWDQMLKNHVQTIVTHFKGKVKAWDVVNEAFNEDGSLRESIWLENMGNNYIEKAFIYAHEADPDALLFYNDYNLEWNSRKRNGVLKFFDELRGKGVRVDGMGLQMHIDACNGKPLEYANAFDDVVDHEYLLHLSEIDISVNPKNKTVENLDDLLYDQAILLGKIVDDYNSLPAAYQYGMTFWGVSDAHSWIRGFYNREDYPLLYDDNYQVKPCYCQLKRHL